ncbi:uncharacterized protein LOC106721978 isoform X4 [Alligator sinensis]|uniref:Uncharacterized protein LOC106721978 isoform X4 n=1 Tax=Alligator sinensis TaxID=38654 RepID=A0A3Q0G6Z0_ALLSI|nr:uncharacterized protein LOC106721978 isoform X4 [Alligator sinensis]
MWRSSRQAAECCELKAVVTLASVTFIGQNMSSCCKTHTHIFPHIQEKGKGRETLYFSSYEPTGWEILQLCGTTSPVLLAAACVIHGDATITSPATAHTTEQPPMVTIPEPWLPFVAQTPAKEKAKEGETVVLNCQFHSPRGPSLAKLMVKWYKEDEKGSRDLLENNVTILANYSRAFMSGDLTQGDASLTILNVTASDHGIYFCQVMLSSGKVLTGTGTKLRIRRALGLFGIEESIGTIIGVVAAGIGGLVVLIIILTPQLRKCFLCIEQGPHQV